MGETQTILEAIPPEAYVVLGKNNPYSLFCIIMAVFFMAIITGFATILYHSFNKSIKEIRLAYKDAYNSRNKSYNYKNENHKNNKK